MIDEHALVDALVAGQLRVATLDVFKTKPPTSSRLLELPNVILTPHIAGLSVKSRKAVIRQAAQSVVDLFQGRTPHGVVNPAALDRR